MTRSIWLVLMILVVPVVIGCRSSEPTVIQPEKYELTESEQANRDREKEALAEQRQ